MINAKDLKEKLMKDPEFKAEYDRIKPQMDTAVALVKARRKAGLSQADLAARLGKSQPYVARLESGNANPSVKTIAEYITATGQKTTLEFA